LGPTRKLRSSRAPAALAAAAVVAAVPLTAASAATHKKPPVRVTHLSDDFFNKGKLTIKKGTIVSWKWHTDDEHTVTEIHGKYSSHQTTKGNYKHRFKKKGTFTVYCAVHPTVMRQKIVVK
jgi:plastocyanin